MTVWPSFLSVFRLIDKLTGFDFQFLQQFAIAERDALAIDYADNTLTGDRAKFASFGELQSFLLRAADNRRGQRMLAATLQTRREAQDLILALSRQQNQRAKCGLPSVKVPVLSTTNVSIFSRTSNASAFLINTPAVAPRPTPTMIDIGVAKPSAQGQAMISTATALSSP